MSTDVIMPQMGESIFEGTITKWLKKAGDAVEKDEPLFEISTDKVDAEIASPVAGMLTEIKIGEGATVQVNTVVAVITESRQAPAQAEKPAAAAEAGTGTKAGGAAEARAGGLQVVMPQMGESIVEGTLTKWLKKVGDAVEKDEPLFEISTDKVDAEIPAPLSGVLTEIRVQEGETVKVNTVVATIGGAVAGAESAMPAKAASAAAQAPQKAAYVAPAVKAVPASSIEPRGRIRSSPLARRIAKEHGIDLNRVAGSGHAGRVTKDDVLRAAAQPQTPAQKTAPPQGPLAPAGELVPLTRMRAIIAERMLQSKRISPHVHTVYKIDMTRVARHRRQHMDAFEQRHGIKLTFMPYIAAAAVAALQRYPVVNASLENGADIGSGGGLGIRYHRNVNLGIAVALDWGLIVPVVRQAEQLDFVALARTIADLAGRARSKKLSPDEVGGSTFTLTNSGVFGDEFSTPIINQPESAILCISALKKEAVVLTDAEGNDTIAIRSMQHFTLGFDHRLIDGADACKFMLELKRVLESWDGEIG